MDLIPLDTDGFSIRNFKTQFVVFFAGYGTGQPVTVLQNDGIGCGCRNKNKSKQKVAENKECKPGSVLHENKSSILSAEISVQDVLPFRRVDFLEHHLIDRFP